MHYYLIKKYSTTEINVDVMITYDPILYQLTLKIDSDSKYLKIDRLFISNSGIYPETKPICAETPKNIISLVIEKDHILKGSIFNIFIRWC